jgi:hypothetical protein
VFKPFWDPSQSELEYCSRMAEWWRGVLEVQKKQMGVVHQISGVPLQARNQGRIHRLISEADPKLPPGGYFDCTVEVII